MAPSTHWRSINLDPRSPRFQSPSTLRACEACARKKVKCDMQRPCCAVCERSGTGCVYPLRRKQTARRRLSTTHALADASESTNGSTQTQCGDSAMSSDNMNTLYQTVSHSTSSSSPNRHDSTDMDTNSGAPEDYVLFTDDQVGSSMTCDDHTQVSHEGFSDVDMQAFDRLMNETPPGQETLDFNDFGAQQVTQAHTESFAIEISEQKADHLISVFFDNVQPFLPLLHRPKILAMISGLKSASSTPYRNLSHDLALLLNGIFSLAARFSRRTDLWTCAASLRGEPFARNSRALVGRQELYAEENWSLMFLQGYIMSAYYDLTARPSAQAFTGIGFCCRMAHAMLLHQIDSPGQATSTQAGVFDTGWTSLEEQRRAWWALVEMDNFASIVGGLPFALSLERAQVNLPVPDEAWFDALPTCSVTIPSKSSQVVWNVLKTNEIEDPYAWYLICNNIMRDVHDTLDRNDRSIEDFRLLESALKCFELSLPSNLTWAEASQKLYWYSPQERNWIISIYMLIQSIKSTIDLAIRKTFLAEDSQTYRLHANDLIDLAGMHLALSPSKPGLPRAIQDQVQAVHMWPAEQVAFMTPLIVVTLLMPAAACALGIQAESSAFANVTRVALDAQILELTLQRFAEWWGLGSICLDLLHEIKSTRLESIPKLRNKWLQNTLARIRMLVTV
ncbi:fungal-specific transcription factor domain-containing protein [Paraphoma chrysanthemicola]|uniref:Fungal-specific transcription factor domain-containing protein n=1 Tax=Paraphoma chrysanthemicola TaxID=798071 RepID=A0A8K0R5D0_9PLEO|nr:fungal-specific transcription factor domain-containing protein [Paraphoma chrysanthemicola]